MLAHQSIHPADSNHNQVQMRHHDEMAATAQINSKIFHY